MKFCKAGRPITPGAYQLHRDHTCEHREPAPAIPPADLHGHAQLADKDNGFFRKAGLELPPWRPACNGAGARPWFVARGEGAEFDRIPVRDRYHFAQNGNLVRYASRESAQRAAGKLNAAEAA